VTVLACAEYSDAALHMQRKSGRTVPGWALLTPNPLPEPGRGSEPPIYQGVRGNAVALHERHPFPNREGAGG
jgi:hypothetical protein